MTIMKYTPLNPLKGKIAANFIWNKLATVTPLRGQGVILCNYKLFSLFSVI